MKQIIKLTFIFVCFAQILNAQPGKYEQKLENDICTDLVIGKFTCTGCATSDKDLPEDVRDDVFKALRQFKYCTVLNRDNLSEIIKTSDEEGEIALINENQKKKAKELYKTAKWILLGNLKIQSDGSLRIKIDISSLSGAEQGAFDIITIPMGKFEVHQTRYPFVEKGIVNMLLGGNLEKPAVVNTLPSDGLVAYYPFNSNANDESGHSNHGVVSGATSTVDRFNNPNSAYKFNGRSDFIKVSNSPSICPVNFTISLWAVLPTSITDSYPRLISKHLDQPGSYGSYQILMGTAAQPTRCIGTAITSRGYVVSESNNAATPGWHNLILTWNGQYLNLYLDNVLVQQEEWSGKILYDANPLYIGRDGVYPNAYFQGTIDDVRIYNRVLTTTEINQLAADR